MKNKSFRSFILSLIESDQKAGNLRANEHDWRNSNSSPNKISSNNLNLSSDHRNVEWPFALIATKINEKFVGSNSPYQLSYILVSAIDERKGRTQPLETKRFLFEVKQQSVIESSIDPNQFIKSYDKIKKQTIFNHQTYLEVFSATSKRLKDPNDQIQENTNEPQLSGLAFKISNALRTALKSNYESYTMFMRFFGIPRKENF